MVKFCTLLCVIISLTACQNPVTTKDLKKVSKPINYQLHFLLAGLPHQKKGTQQLAFLQEDTKNWQVSMAAGVSSGGGGIAGGMPLTSGRVDTLNSSFYGTLEQLFDPISYIFEEHGIEKKQIQLKTDFVKPTDDTVLLIIDIKTSEVIDTQPTTTFGIGVGGGKNNAVGGVGASYGDRSWCHAQMTGTVTFVTKDHRSSRYELDAKGRDVKKDRENAAKVAYQSAAEQFAKEILYQFFKQIN